jgi:4-amino-4-deoxy-L-arabinose transferase-like glycosyltransferase
VWTWLERAGACDRDLTRALIAIGVALRLWEFAARRSLWNDETTIALNIASRSFGELLSPLDLGQAAPPLFLLLTKAATEAFGVNEWALRLPSFMGGVLLLPLFAAVARRVLAGRAATLAVALVALAPGLVYYSNEVKPYGLDAFLTCALLWTILRFRDRPSGLNATTTAAAGVLAVWMSYPAIFVLAAVGLAMVIADVRSDPRVRVSASIAIGASWLASFGLAYSMTYQQVSADTYMRRFWSASFLFASPRPLSRLAEVVGGPMSGTFLDRDFFTFLPEAVRLGVLACMLILLLMGIVALYRHQGAVRALFVVGPMAMAGAAYLLGRYPVALRLLIFAAPLAALLVAAGVRAVSRSFGTGMFAATAAALLLPASYHAVLQVRDPWRRLEQPRPVILALAERLAREPEPVWLAPGAAGSWVFYTTEWSAPDTARLRHLMRHATPPDGLAFPNHMPREKVPDPRDGAALLYHRVRYVELLGSFSGQEYRMGLPARDRPDVGWAEVEARRIDEAVERCGWLLFVSGPRAAKQALSQSLRSQSLTRSESVRGRRAEAIRVCRASEQPLHPAVSRR